MPNPCIIAVCCHKAALSGEFGLAFTDRIPKPLRLAFWPRQSQTSRFSFVDVCTSPVAIWLPSESTMGSKPPPHTGRLSSASREVASPNHVVYLGVWGRSRELREKRSRITSQGSNCEAHRPTYWRYTPKRTYPSSRVSVLTITQHLKRATRVASNGYSWPTFLHIR